MHKSNIKFVINTNEFLSLFCRSNLFPLQSAGPCAGHVQSLFHNLYLFSLKFSCNFSFTIFVCVVIHLFVCPRNNIKPKIVHPVHGQTHEAQTNCDYKFEYGTDWHWLEPAAITINYMYKMLFCSRPIIGI